MRLQFPFPERVRNLYLYCYACFQCGRNGNGVGGLELHHVYGRISDSAFNAAVLCKLCHEHICNSDDEHQRLYAENLRWLSEAGYEPTEHDWEFLRSHPELIDGEHFRRFTSK